MIIFILTITFYTIYLNIRIRDFEQYVENELDDLHLQQEDNKLYCSNDLSIARFKVSKAKVSKD